MKRTALILFLLAFGAVSLYAGDARNVVVVRQGDSLVVKMDLDLTASYLRSNSVFLLRPVLRAGPHERMLKAVGLYTRNQFFHYLRNAPGGQPYG